MQVGICRVELRLPENQSLKGKRQVVKSIVDRVRHRFNVSIAEVDDQDLWQRITLGISCVSNQGQHANEILSHVVNFIEAIRGDAELLDYEIEVTPAF
ncbi:MAG: DUF503 domain-containing protein [Chloroflexi bacterium]|nr:DUF503 domain-containing protein [Chloroflexota bacterium]